MDRIYHFESVAAGDVAALVEAEKHYGESWFKRDGAGAFFMLARKWDRLENHLQKRGNFNILSAVKEDRRAEGIIDDIRDLRRYLILVEAKLAEQRELPPEVRKGAPPAPADNLARMEAEIEAEQPVASSLHPS